MVKQSTKSRAEGGFTLIELLVVVTIVGLLAGIAVVGVGYAQRKAIENVLKHDLASMRKSIDDFYADKQRYPASLQELVESKYLRKIPSDPVTKSPDTWKEVRAEEELDPIGSDFSTPSMFDDPSEQMQGPGIVDVKSGAPGQTMDNPPVPYGDL